MNKTKKIVITGPESSGKSWLCKQLSDYFYKPWASEYARIFLEKHGKAYDFDTLETIIKRHLEHQQKVIQQAQDLVFLDTDLINFKVWEELVFGKTHSFLEKEIKKEQDHLYLLTYPDLPWEPDPLRENPENRMEIFERHRWEIEKLGRKHMVVRGQGNERLYCATAATSKLLS